MPNVRRQQWRIDYVERGGTAMIPKGVRWSVVIFLLENLDLDTLARDKVTEFALVVLPLKIEGGTGSTVAPIAMK